MMNSDYRLKQLIRKRQDCLEWHQSAYEVVKYHPANYNENGHYVKKEWTSMWDIGRSFDGKNLTIDDYLEIENEYVEVAMDVMKECGCRLITVVFWGGTIKTILPRILKRSPLRESDIDLYKSIFGLRSGSRIHINKIEPLLRLALREWKDFVFISFSHNVQIDIGYDYYMHIHASIDKDRLRSIVESKNLFLNPRDRIR